MRIEGTGSAQGAFVETVCAIPGPEGIVVSSFEQLG